MQKQRLDWIVLFLFIFSFALRLSLISQGPYHIDCLNLAIQAEKTLDTLKLQYLFGPGYPLTVLLGAFFIWLARLIHITDPVIAVNFMSVVFGSLCVPTLYLICKRLFNSTAALLSALMFSVLPVFLALSTYGKSHTPSLFFLLLCIYYALKFLDSQNTRFLLISALLAGFMGAARIQDLILLSPAISFLILFGVHSDSHNKAIKQTKKLIVYWVFAFIVIVLFHTPLILKSLSVYQSQAQVFWKIGMLDNFQGIISINLWIVYFVTMANFTAGGILFAVIGLALLFKKHSKTALFLFLWFLIPILFYGNVKTSITRFFVISYIPLIISQGFIFDYLMRVGKIVRYAVLVFFCTILFLMISGIYPILHFRHTHAPLKDYSLWVKEHTPDNAVIITSDEGFFISHYGSRKIVYQLFNYSGSVSDEEFLEWNKTVLKKYFEKDIPVYVTLSGLFGNNKTYKFAEFISSHYHLELIGSHLSHNWYYGETFNNVGQSQLWKLSPK